MNIQRPQLLQKLLLKRHNGMVKVVTGIRRAGKSYLLNRLLVDYLLRDGVSPDHIISIDLEQMENIPLREPMAIWQYIKERTIDSNIHYVIIDEIQHLRDFEELLNTLIKRMQYDVYVTGSNARFLSKDVITIFRGRGDELRVYPFSFREYTEARPELTQFHQQLNEYMLYGGLPQVYTFATDTQKHEYLQSLFESTYLLDIKERNGIRNDADLAELVDVLASSIGSLTSPLKLQNTFKTIKQSNISYDTVTRYLDCLQDAFLISQAKRYNIKGRRYIDTPQKYYFEDLGLRNARLGFRQTEQTHLLENLVYNELRRRGWLIDVGNVEHHPRDSKGVMKHIMLEVDFVCNRGYERVYVQVAYALPTEDKWEQELRPLNLIGDSFRKVLIVADFTPTHQNQDGILILNIYDFLMGEEI